MNFLPKLALIFVIGAASTFLYKNLSSRVDASIPSAETVLQRYRFDINLCLTLDKNTSARREGKKIYLYETTNCQGVPTSYINVGEGQGNFFGSTFFAEGMDYINHNGSNNSILLIRITQKGGT